MTPMAIVAVAGGAFTLYKLLKKPTFQTVVGPGGTKIVVPVPETVNKQQATGQSTTPPAPAGSGGKPVVVPTNRGPVFAPPKTVQQGSGGDIQPAPIVVTPSGSSSTAIGSVADVQRALNTLGVQPTLAVDGISGPKTQANVRYFQAHASPPLVVDGNAGPATKAALASALAAMAASGSTVGPMVQSPVSNPQGGTVAPDVTLPPVDTSAALAMSPKDVQTNLNILGATPPLVVDGKIGPKSVAAIKAFQASHGLAADGIAGPKTKTAIWLAIHQGGGGT
jgi:peptidoglycan hydrolase-like protein with peptidoglycan-binding domain